METGKPGAKPATARPDDRGLYPPRFSLQELYPVRPVRSIRGEA
nr:hypothetical protein [Candidatus Sigynarchaeum springense]